MTAPMFPDIPSKPINLGVATGTRQIDRRYMDTFFDVHTSARFPRGRPWCGPREIAANRENNPRVQDGFCIGDLMQGEYVEDEQGNMDRHATLRAGWQAPWVPLAKYFKFNYPRKRISFDYALMLREARVAYDNYFAAAARLGANLNRRVEYGEEPHFQITQQVGVLGPYLRELRVAEAAMAGDRWLLGHIDEPNEDLAKILGFNTRGMKVLSYEPTAPEPVATPAQVLAMPNEQMMAMLLEMATKAGAAAAMAAIEAQDQKKKGASPEQMQRMRDAKQAKSSAPAEHAPE